MSILAAFAVPHPPLIVPAVGKGEEKRIQATIDGYRCVAGEIAGLKPDTIIVLSPHATAYADFFHVSPGAWASGNLKRFRGDVQTRIQYDGELTERLSAFCGERGFPAGTRGEEDASLDHGVLIPVHFMQEVYPAAQYVRIGVSGLSLQEHYALGMLLQETASRMGRDAVIVASGDLSHKLTEDGPYGYSPDGPKFDAALVSIMKSGNFGELFALDPSLCENAAECGLRCFGIMAGALDQSAVNATLHSYEGPFGVGYAVASFRVTGKDPPRSRGRTQPHTRRQGAPHRNAASRARLFDPALPP